MPLNNTMYFRDGCLVSAELSTAVPRPRYVCTGWHNAIKKKTVILTYISQLSQHNDLLVGLQRSAIEIEGERVKKLKSTRE